jgi:hypothetical protein
MTLVNARIVLSIFALTIVASAPAFAQANPNVAYQSALLSRSLSAADQTFCAGKGGSQDDQNACHVTRLLLADAARNQDKGFPPLTDIRFTAGKAETSQILDLMTKYGG